MRNLNGRFLILVGEGNLEWGRGGYLVVTWTTVLHEQRVMTARGTSRKGGIFMPQVRHADGGCPLRFLDFDAGELAWSVACPTGAADEADSLERSRMITFCTR